MTVRLIAYRSQIWLLSFTRQLLLTLICFVSISLSRGTIECMFQMTSNAVPEHRPVDPRRHPWEIVYRKSYHPLFQESATVLVSTHTLTT